MSKTLARILYVEDEPDIRMVAQMALEAVASGYADMVAWGKDFIANPDLVERLRRDAPLNPGRRELYYGGGAEGYTDYPRLAD